MPVSGERTAWVEALTQPRWSWELDRWLQWGPLHAVRSGA